jgi:putative DNA primase/helicase
MKEKTADLYTELGLSTIPLVYKAKTPVIPWKEFQQRKASIEEYSSWFNDFTNNNVGIVTGSISGIVVLCGR